MGWESGVFDAFLYEESISTVSGASVGGVVLKETIMKLFGVL